MYNKEKECPICGFTFVNCFDRNICSICYEKENPQVETKTFNVTITIQVQVKDLSLSNRKIADKISSECNYSIEYEDEVCKVIATELVMVKSD